MDRETELAEEKRRVAGLEPKVLSQQEQQQIQSHKYEMLEWELQCTRDVANAAGVWGAVDAEFKEGRFFW